LVERKPGGCCESTQRYTVIRWLRKRRRQATGEEGEGKKEGDNNIFYSSLAHPQTAEKPERRIVDHTAPEDMEPLLLHTDWSSEGSRSLDFAKRGPLYTMAYGKRTQ